MKSNAFDGFRQQVRGWAATSLTVLFGLQLLRMLFSSLVGYLRDAQGLEALSLAPIALGVFATSFLAGLLRRMAGARRAIWITAGGVGLARLAEQISSSPALDLVLSAIGTALFLLFIPNALGVARTKSAGARRLGFAFLLGVATDTAIQVMGRTLDLSWQPGIIPVAMLALLAIGLFVALRASSAEIVPQAVSDATWGRSLALLALGPWLFLQLLVYQNIARVSALTGWETPAAGALVVLGNALGLAVAAWATRPGQKTAGLAVLSGLLLMGSLLFPEPHGVLAALLLVTGQVLSLALAMMLFAGLGRNVTQAGLLRTRERLADRNGCVLVSSVGDFATQVLIDRTGGDQGASVFIVDDLGVEVFAGTKHTQTRTDRVALDAVSYAKASPLPLLVDAFFVFHGRFSLDPLGRGSNILAQVEFTVSFVSFLRSSHCLTE